MSRIRLLVFPRGMAGSRDSSSEPHRVAKPDRATLDDHPEGTGPSATGTPEPFKQTPLAMLMWCCVWVASLGMGSCKSAARGTPSCPLRIIVPEAVRTVGQLRPSFEAAGTRRVFVLLPGPRIVRSTEEALDGQDEEETIPVDSPPSGQYEEYRLDWAMSQSAWEGVQVEIGRYLYEFPAGKYRIEVTYSLSKPPRPGQRVCLYRSRRFDILEASRWYREE